MSEIDTKNTDCSQELDNLKIGFEQIKTTYLIQLERLKNADEKLNMVLGFNGVILALLITVLPFEFENQIKLVLSIVLFSTFITSIFLTLIIIFKGLFPTKVNHIDSCIYTDPATYHCTIEQFIGKFMSGYQNSIYSIEKSTEKKHILNKHAMIFTFANILIIVALIIIKII